MFELFAQGDRSLARSEGGLGIGLTVVKKLVEMHGGSVAADERGARARGASSPSACPRPTRPAPPTPRGGPHAATGRDAARDPRRRRQRGHGPRAGAAPEAPRPRGASRPTTGPTAIEAARDHRPEFVLLDIGLPGMDGYEVAARLRREECCRARRHHRRLGLRPGRGPPPLAGGRVRPPPRQAGRPRRPAHPALGRVERPGVRAGPSPRHSWRRGPAACRSRWAWGGSSRPRPGGPPARPRPSRRPSSPRPAPTPTAGIARRRRVSSRPSRTGIITSVRTRSGVKSARQSRASWPSAASLTSKPPCRRMRAKRLRSELGVFDEENPHGDEL